MIVTSLHRWPVKSMGGERVDALRVDGRGAAGDRTHAVLDARRSTPERAVLLTAREAPRLLAWHATYDGVPGDAIDPDDPPLPLLQPPGGGAPLRWDDPALPERLAEDLGRPVVLRRDFAGQQDLADTLLVTFEATFAAVDAALGGGLDLRRFRPNVHVTAPDVSPYAEERWTGCVLETPGATLDLLDPCARCVIPTRDPDTQEKRAEILRWLTRERDGLFGINARPRGPATIRAGDRVAVLSHPVD